MPSGSASQAPRVKTGGLVVRQDPAAVLARKGRRKGQRQQQQMRGIGRIVPVTSVRRPVLATTQTMEGGGPRCACSRRPPTQHALLGQSVTASFAALGLAAHAKKLELDGE